MRSKAPGTKAEVTRISNYGIWLLVAKKKLFLSFGAFPWFRNAPVSAIQNVKPLNAHHLYWPDLDVDLTVESIEHPESFPLIST